MPGINDALQQIDNLKPSEKISYRRMTKDARCDRTTLSRRHQGVQVDFNTKNVRQRKVTPQQEDDLVQYIIGLTERHSPPTREMIKNFVRGLAHVKVSETWVTHFLQRHRDINKYSIKPRHTYNMDKKGFMAGVIGKQKRVFSKALFKHKKKHLVYTTVSPSGWSNNDAGLG
ncbi:hypothetical protein EJ07DRAFT_165631 [Lizonia empirigonia]|nr:hypothetical protein EJ07DRAFT_165631 [Lizonia empirigonia]